MVRIFLSLSPCIPRGETRNLPLPIQVRGISNALTSKNYLTYGPLNLAVADTQFLGLSTCCRDHLKLLRVTVLILTRSTFVKQQPWLHPTPSRWILVEIAAPMRSADQGHYPHYPATLPLLRAGQGSGPYRFIRVLRLGCLNLRGV